MRYPDLKTYLANHENQHQDSDGFEEIEYKSDSRLAREAFLQGLRTAYHYDPVNTSWFAMVVVCGFLFAIIDSIRACFGYGF